MKIDGVEIHKDITPEIVREACERYQLSLDNPGFCLECGGEQDGCEPDAEGLECEHCGERKVMGAEEIMIRSA